MNNVEWGWVNGSRADLLTPGTNAGEGRCNNGEWGVIVESAAVYGSLGTLRAWAQSLLAQLPPDRDGEPLVRVDLITMTLWLAEKVTADPDVEVTFDQVETWMREIAADPGVAGWSLGAGVAGLWAGLDDDASFTAGVSLAPYGPRDSLSVGMEPMGVEDMPILSQLKRGPVECGARVLAYIAERINAAY